MTINKSIKIAVAAVALTMTASAVPNAGPMNHENRLTFNQPVSLPGVTLAAGQYTFDLEDPNAPEVVVVRNTHTRRVLYVGFTNTIRRPRNASAPAIVFGEAPADQARPIAAWYEIGDTVGHQFLYR